MTYPLGCFCYFLNDILTFRALLSEKVPDEGEKSGGSPEDKKNVAGQEDLGVLAVKSGADMDDHEYRERHQHQRHEYCVEYFQCLVSHDCVFLLQV